MGASDEVPLTPVDQLALQVNRFTGTAPAAYNFHAAAFATGNPLDLDLASTAMLIYQRRAMDSYAKFQDAASSALIQNANTGMADPVGWVGAHLLDVTTVVKGYADSVGLPAAQGATVVEKLSTAGPFGIPLWGYAAAGAAGVVYMLTHKTRRR